MIEKLNKWVVFLVLFLAGTSVAYFAGTTKSYGRLEKELAEIRTGLNVRASEQCSIFTNEEYTTLGEVLKRYDLKFNPTNSTWEYYPERSVDDAFVVIPELAMAQPIDSFEKSLAFFIDQHEKMAEQFREAAKQRREYLESKQRN